MIIRHPLYTKMGFILLGGIGGILFMPCCNYTVGWLAHFFLATGKPVGDGFGLLFVATQRWVAYCFAALGISAALSWCEWRAGNRYKAAAVCIGGGLVVSMFATTIALSNIWRAFQMVDQSRIAKSLTPNKAQWKIGYALRYLSQNSPIYAALLIILIGFLMLATQQRQRST